MYQWSYSMQFIDYSDFRKNLSKSSTPPIHKDYLIKAAPAEDTESRIVTFTASTADVDRMGDVINQSGWKLDNFLQNPVVLYGHDSSRLPIGHAIDVRFVDGNLTLDVDFTPREIQAFADTVYQMILRGDLRAGSVGMQPLKWAWVETDERYGVDFIEQELLEFSIVAIPANARALAQKAVCPDVASEPVAEPFNPIKMQNRLKYLKAKGVRI
jgi:HK97 family phage prohead protease